MHPAGVMLTIPGQGGLKVNGSSGPRQGVRLSISPAEMCRLITATANDSCFAINSYPERHPER